MTRFPPAQVLFVKKVGVGASFHDFTTQPQLLFNCDEISLSSGYDKISSRLAFNMIKISILEVLIKVGTHNYVAYCRWRDGRGAGGYGECF